VLKQPAAGCYFEPCTPVYVSLFLCFDNQRAAQFLQDEADQWEEENNSIIQLAKKMAMQMMQMAQFARGRGDLQVPQ
jgi:hypothetical protein